MKKFYIVLFLSVLTKSLYSQDVVWDQGVPLCPEDKYITNLIDKLGPQPLRLVDSVTNNSNVKIFREIGFAFYDKGEYEAADWYFKKAKKYKEKVEIEKTKPKPSDAEIKNMEADLKFLDGLPKSYDNLSKNEMVKLAKIIDKKILELSKERDSLLKTKSPSKELIDTKNNSIETLNKEKKVINLTIESDDLKNETNGLKKERKILKEYLWWFKIETLIFSIILVLIIIALIQRKSIKIKDTEIDEQLKDINKKNKYLEYSARIIRHDMHSGINTYIPRGISSLEKRLKPEDITNLKIEPSIKMIKEGLIHTQKVYKKVYEFTNLVKQQVVLEKELTNTRELLKTHFSNTSYNAQVEIFDLVELEINPILFCNAIENLVKNGLQYNNNETKLVKIYMSGETIIIEDNGVGFSQKDLERVTGRYLNKKDESENGLGLIISKTILEEHGFTLSTAQSEVGTKIKITVK